VDCEFEVAILPQLSLMIECYGTTSGQQKIIWPTESPTYQSSSEPEYFLMSRIYFSKTSRQLRLPPIHELLQLRTKFELHFST